MVLKKIHCKQIIFRGEKKIREIFFRSQKNFIPKKNHPQNFSSQKIFIPKTIFSAILNTMKSVGCCPQPTAHLRRVPSRWHTVARRARGGRHPALWHTGINFRRCWVHNTMKTVGCCPQSPVRLHRAPARWYTVGGGARGGRLLPSNFVYHYLYFRPKCKFQPSLEMI